MTGPAPAPVAPCPVPDETSPPALTRSPIYLFTLVSGVLVTGLGWVLATVFERSLVATSADLAGLAPSEVRAFLPSLLMTATVGCVVVAHLWLLGARQIRRLALVDLALVMGAGAAYLASHVLFTVLRPETRALFPSMTHSAVARRPSDVAAAGLVAALVVARPWIGARGRRMLYGLVPIWLLCSAVVGNPPYLTGILGLGLGMVVGSAVPLALRTPSPRCQRGALIDGLAANGVPLVDLQPAAVDARGSEPWLGTTPEGGTVFVKALSSEQRVADLMFRAARWARLRRAGDAPPEISLQRAAEHEAFLSHHARSLGLTTPRLLTVADLGDDGVALAYGGMAGRSLDHTDRAEVSDELMRAVWSQVAMLRDHGVAHRDLRLANVFLRSDGTPALIDFSFAELSASRQLLDTDVAELLAASAAVLGVDRAVAAAVEGIGQEAVLAAREWLLPSMLTSATRQAIHQVEGGFQALREAIGAMEEGWSGDVAGDPVPVPLLVGAVLVSLGLYGGIALGFGDDLGGRLAGLDGPLVTAAALVASLVHPARGLALRSAASDRVSVGLAVTTSLASHAPAPGPTYWANAATLVSAAARQAGMSTASAARVVSIWVDSGLAVAPVLVTGLTVSGLQSAHGYLRAVAIALLLGSAMLVAELVALRSAPMGWDLTAVLPRSGGIGQLRPRGPAGAMAWWVAARGAQSAALVLVARAAGATVGTEALVAVAIGAIAMASLSPAPGGIGVAELLLFVGLVVVGADAGTAAFVAVVGRLVTFWIQAPAAVLARRALTSGPKPEEAP